MAKLRLDLDAIEVTSFPTETLEEGHGTVKGFDATPVLACAPSGTGSCESCFPNYCPREPNTTG